MEYYNFRGKQNTLTDALQLDVPEHAVISITGAGGKTSLLFAWAQEFSAAGRRTVVTTTTHMFHPAHGGAGADSCSSLTLHNQMIYPERYPCYSVICADTADAEYHDACLLTDRFLDNEGLVMVVSEDNDNPNKVTQPPAPVMEHLYKTADVVLIEADGSRRMPLKWPAPWEPAVPDCSDITVCVAGLSSLGRSVNDVMYRAECIPEGWKRGTVDKTLIRAILASGEGGQKGARGEFRVFLTQADTDQLKKAASDIQMLLAVSGIQSAWGTLLTDRGLCGACPCQAQV